MDLAFNDACFILLGLRLRMQEALEGEWFVSSTYHGTAQQQIVLQRKNSTSKVELYCDDVTIVVAY